MLDEFHFGPRVYYPDPVTITNFIQTLVHNSWFENIFSPTYTLNIFK